MVTSMALDRCKVLFTDLAASMGTLLWVKLICAALQRGSGMQVFLVALKVLKDYGHLSCTPKFQKFRLQCTEIKRLIGVSQTQTFQAQIISLRQGYT